MGRLGATLGSVVEGEEDGAILLPCGAFGDYGDPGVAGAVGGVTLFLKDAEEVIAVIFPSTIFVYGVLRWQGYVRWECEHWSRGGGMLGLCGWLSGASAGMMERMRCCRWPLWVGVCVWLEEYLLP